MLSVRRLSVSYGSILALRDVSLEVHDREVVALLGANGAGKSTLLHAICGVVGPTGGEILFEDQTVTGTPCERIARRGIALVPEGRRIFGSLTVSENLALGATVRGKDPTIVADRERLFDRFPVLRRKLDSHADSLSGGEQQQLAIARAVLGRPKLLLLDEPSLGLAPVIVDEVFAALAELRDDGLTMLLVEQHARRALEFADRSYVLHNGRITMEPESKQLGLDADLSGAYLG